ncbi:MAG: metal-dependent hydrolase [Alicyclobacillus sp.]|nr:metal-dependent hydrolase [Alicyclobacillus sp.]
MMGRTHITTGAIGAVVATPFVLHAHWEPMRQLLDSDWNTIPHAIVTQAVFVGATMVGALVPDLDQPDALMARKIEVFFGLPVLVIAAVLILLLHHGTSLTAWGLTILLTVLFGAAKNTTRILGLGVLAAGILYLGWHKQIPLEGSILLAIWMVGAAVSKHRTFTHSIIGAGLFASGINLCTHLLNTLHISMIAPGLVLGYVVHLAGDAMAGGVPLLWPWGQRFGVRLIQTGGAVDYMIGGLALFGFAAMAII